MMHQIQRKLLRLASQYDLSPLSYREIGKLIDVESAQKIRHHLSQLIKKGLIKGIKGHGNIQLANPTARPNTFKELDMVAIPIFGSANCGEATLYADNNLEGYLRVSENLLIKKNDIFAIQAVGDSMNRAKIHDKYIENGDYVIVDGAKKQPTNNSYVLSVIDGVANIKKFIKDDKNEQIVLVSESTSNYPPIYIHISDSVKYLVNGEVIQVIKKPRT